MTFQRVDETSTCAPDVATGDLESEAVVGSDLTFDSESGNITSTAGGTYSVIVQYSGRWSV